MQQKRNEIIDFYKGVLMFGVIWGHTITALKGGLDVGTIFIHTFLRTYDMPFFMILSGFFLTKSLLRDQSKRVLLNRGSMILFPILLWNLISLNWHFSSFYFLWAIFMSSCICIAAHYFSNLIGRHKQLIELIIEMMAIFALHMINIPCNLFYLFPFFVVGRHLPNIDFKLSHITFSLIIFVLALCFWQGKYSPWSLGADAWKENPTEILVYLYRFGLGIIGTFFMANIFKVLHSLQWAGKSIIFQAGSQTLGIYIIQTFLIERFLQRGVKYIIENHNISYTPTEVNVLAYIIAPLITLFTLKMTSEFITKVEKTKYLQYAFGFKLIKK